MSFILCPACRGQKTLLGSGSITRVKCHTCDGLGEKEIIEDPIGELEKLQQDIASKKAEIASMEVKKPAKAKAKAATKTK